MMDAPEPPPTEQGLHPAAADFIAGGVAGAAGVLAGQPLDTVRIRMQQPGCPWGSAGAALRATVAREGPAALFRGVTYPLATISFQNAIVFQAFGIASRHLMHESGGTSSPLTYPQTFLSGMAAGVVQTFIVAPVELLKVRQQLQTAVAGDAAYVGPVRLLRQTMRAEGVRGLYRGLGVTMVRDTPSHGVYFCVYDAAREALDPGSRARGSSAPAASFTAGGLAGASSWLSVYPIDVLKSRIQATSAADSRFSSWAHCAQKSYREEGAGVFVRGLNATLTRAFMVSAVIFSVYEGALGLMTGQNVVAVVDSI